MELKDLTRPLLVIKMEEFKEDYTKENVEKFDNHDEGTIFIRGVNEDGEWLDYICPACDIQEELGYALGMAVSFVEDGYTDIKVFYSTYENIFNLDMSSDDIEDDYEDFFMVALECLTGAEDRDNYLNTDIEYDVLYSDPYEGYHLFTVCDNEYSTYMGDDENEIVEMVEREMDKQ